MALATSILHDSLILNYLEHKRITVEANGTLTLLTGITGKRIRIWRIHIYCATAAKTCTLYSGTNAFHPVASLAEKKDWTEHAVNNVPVFTCNAGENFIATPNDQTSWQFYLVYSIE